MVLVLVVRFSFLSGEFPTKQTLSSQFPLVFFLLLVRTVHDFGDTSSGFVAWRLNNLSWKGRDAKTRSYVELIFGPEQKREEEKGRERERERKLSHARVTGRGYIVKEGEQAALGWAMMLSLAFC